MLRKGRGGRHHGQEGFKVRNQWAQALPVQGRNSDRAIPFTQCLGFLRGHAIAFVQDRDARNGIQIQRLKNAVDCPDLLIDIGRGGIYHMEQEVGITEFVQGRAKGADQVLGKVPDKPDRIGDDDLPVVREAQAAAGGVERFKKPVLRGDLAVGQGVKQRGFSGVRIPDDGENGEPLSDTLCPALILMAGDIRDFPFQVRDAITDTAAISFEFGFARSAGADASSQA